MPLISYSHQKKKKKNSTVTGLIFYPDMVPGSVRVTARLIRRHSLFFFFFFFLVFVMMKVKEKFWMKFKLKLTVAIKFDAVCDQ